MYRAQCVEQSIIQLIVYCDFFPKQVSQYTTTERWAQEFDRFDEMLSEKTMGQLIKKLTALGVVDTSIESLLREAITKRNHLAHRFFVDHGLSFVSTTGRDRMIKELEDNSELFVSVENTLNPVTYKLCEKYGLTQEKLKEIECQLFEQAKSDHSPP